MWNPFKKDPTPPMFDPFEVAEEEARINARIAEMGAAETRLIKATQRAEKATKDAKAAYEQLEAAVSRSRRRTTGGRSW
jgi:hypothetical protein